MLDLCFIHSILFTKLLQMTLDYYYKLLYYIKNGAGVPISNFNNIVS